MGERVSPRQATSLICLTIASASAWLYAHRFRTAPSRALATLLSASLVLVGLRTYLAVNVPHSARWWASGALLITHAAALPATVEMVYARRWPRTTAGLWLASLGTWLFCPHVVAPALTWVGAPPAVATLALAASCAARRQRFGTPGVALLMLGTTELVTAAALGGRWALFAWARSGMVWCVTMIAVSGLLLLGRFSDTGAT